MSAPWCHQGLRDRSLHNHNRRSRHVYNLAVVASFEKVRIAQRGFMFMDDVIVRMRMRSTHHP